MGARHRTDVPEEYLTGDLHEVMLRESRAINLCGIFVDRIAGYLLRSSPLFSTIIDCMRVVIGIQLLANAGVFAQNADSADSPQARRVAKIAKKKTTDACSKYCSSLELGKL